MESVEAWAWDITIFKENDPIYQQTVYFQTQQKVVEYADWLRDFKDGTGFYIKRGELLYRGDLIL